MNIKTLSLTGFSKNFIKIAVIFIIYFATARIGLLLAFEHTNASAIWPPSGIALSAVLLFGYRVWPGIALGAFFANIWTLSSLGFSVPVSIMASLSTAFGNTLEALLGAYLVNIFIKNRNPFDRFIDVLKFVIFGAIINTAICATIGANTFCLSRGDWSNYSLIWSTWWLGDTAGVVVIVPLALTWGKRKTIDWQPHRVVEAGMLVVSLLILGNFVFRHSYPLMYLMLPFLIWAAFRFGQFGSAWAVLLLSLVATLGTVSGLGPFVSVAFENTLLGLQGYVSIISLTIISLSSVFFERGRAEERLRESEERFRAMAENAPLPYQSLDITGRFKYVNQAWLDTLGYTKEEVVGRWFGDFLAPGWEKTFEKAFSVFKTEGEACDREFEMVKKNGSVITVSFEGRIGHDEKGEFKQAHCIFTDITERKESEEKLRDSLKEKDILLQELNHRVNNNLQLISNLLSLQRRYIIDKADISLFDENQNRIRSIALVHEKLYLSKGFSTINLSAYISDLASSIFHSFMTEEGVIKLKIDVEDIPMEIERAVTCGLIINELLSNSLKYAFPDEREGEVMISLHKAGKDSIELAVGNNGVGIPDGIDPRTAKTLGMQLVYILAEKQLDGFIELDRKNGTTFKITFKYVPVELPVG